jgi:murein L,D-transpeptidase YcbB/YkuD
LRVQVLAVVLLAACGQPPERPGTARSADGSAEAIAPAASGDAAVPRGAGAEAPEEVLCSLDTSPPATAAALAGPVAARFVRDGALTRQARLVAAALAGAADAGLDPAEYAGGAWADRFRALDGGRATPEEADRLETDLRSAALRFARALRHGRASPQALGYALPPEPFDAKGFVDALATAADPSALLDSLAPRLPEYDRLVHALPRLRALAERRRSEPPLPSPRGPCARASGTRPPSGSPSSSPRSAISTSSSARRPRRTSSRPCSPTRCAGSRRGTPFPRTGWSAGARWRR